MMLSVASSQWDYFFWSSRKSNFSAASLVSIPRAVVGVGWSCLELEGGIEAVAFLIPAQNIGLAISRDIQGYPGQYGLLCY